MSSRRRAALLLAAALLFGGAASAQRWSADEIAVIASLRLNRLPPATPDLSNAVERSEGAAALGKRLFNDPRFSGNRAVACASCHAADRQFQDGRPLGQGVGSGQRRTMPVVGAGRGPWLFWDGRKDSLWSQALGPLEDAAEHGGNRLRYVRLLQAHYRADYETLFGPLPPLPAQPQDAGPLGTPAERAAWATLAPRTRDGVNRAFANLGKLIAAYENTLAFGESPFDRYAQSLVGGAAASLSPQQVNGLRLFIGRGQCVSCHNGPLLSDQQFHNTGVPPRDPARPDRGRALAPDAVQRDEFNCLGPYSDAPPGACQELRFMNTGDDPALEAAFKTPSLRNVALRPPYMHAGQFDHLDAVIAHYVKAPVAAAGRSELRAAGRLPIRLNASEAADIVAFLATLSGPIVEGAAP
jgi:cytochrome c peroxidase